MESGTGTSKTACDAADHDIAIAIRAHAQDTGFLSGVESPPKTELTPFVFPAVPRPRGSAYPREFAQDDFC
jgi:hypothetical protein